MVIHRLGHTPFPVNHPVHTASGIVLGGDNTVGRLLADLGQDILCRNSEGGLTILVTQPAGHVQRTVVADFLHHPPFTVPAVLGHLTGHGHTHPQTSRTVILLHAHAAVRVGAGHKLATGIIDKATGAARFPCRPLGLGHQLPARTEGALGHQATFLGHQHLPAGVQVLGTDGVPGRVRGADNPVQAIHHLAALGQHPHFPRRQVPAQGLCPQQVAERIIGHLHMFSAGH
ncbi:hypothetical protein [Grimontia celer]|uniref:hypothetical protein n=1 Tax=Grimontia celer TaxID=1796497 RepID=UPI001E3E2C2F|nr:hypothetical protein [Grimontia celer]